MRFWAKKWCEAPGQNDYFIKPKSCLLWIPRAEIGLTNHFVVQQPCIVFTCLDSLEIYFHCLFDLVWGQLFSEFIEPCPLVASHVCGVIYGRSLMVLDPCKTINPQWLPAIPEEKFGHFQVWNTNFGHSFGNPNLGTNFSSNCVFRPIKFWLEEPISPRPWPFNCGLAGFTKLQPRSWQSCKLL